MTVELGRGRAWENSEEHARESLGCLEQTLSRNTDVNSTSKDSEGVRNMVGKT